MKQLLKKGRAKGTVLFTVVAVMMVMVVFLMSTLILTSSANRRSYYTYFETQAQYAAQAALDAITNSAYSDKNFYDWVVANATTIGTQQPITVEFDGTDIQIPKDAANKRNVHCTVEKVDNNYVWDEDTKKIHEQNAWKITATANVGSGKNAAEYTICNYIYANVRETPVTGKNEVSWSYVSALTATSVTTPGSSVTTTGGSLAHAICSMGSMGSAPGVGADNLSSYGPMYANMAFAPVGRTKYDWNYESKLQNDCPVVGNVILVGDTTMTCQKDFIIQTAGEGIVVYGNYDAPNYFHVRSTLTAMPTEYKDLPYVYVDGTFRSSGGAVSIGNETKDNLTTSATEQPVNLYAGAIDANDKPIYVNGDIYLYDSELDSNIHSNSGKTNLTHFVENNVQKANYSFKGYVGGDVICNNRTLSASANDNCFQVGGDLVMTNPDGLLSFSGMSAPSISGALVSAGSIEFKNSSRSTTIKGGIYADPAKVTIETGVTINGKRYEGGDMATYLASVCDASAGIDYILAAGGKGTDTNTSAHARIETLNLVINAGTAAATAVDKYKDVVNQILTSKQSVQKDDGTWEVKDVGLFPYSSRLDEIFFHYIRWDLQKPDRASAEALMSTDPLIQESIKAGHVWAVQSKTNNGTTIYVPYTEATASKKNSFITELTPGSSLKPSIDYQDTKWVTGTMNEYVKPSAQSPCKVVYHEDTGAPRMENENAYLITESCILNFTKANFGQNGTIIYIDPTVNGHDDTNPLVIYMTGDAKNVKLLVNNTYDSKTGKSYADENRFAGRQEVIFFFCDDFKGEKFYTVCTGAYEMYGAIKDENRKGKFNVISNPIYPNAANWGTLPANVKYKYELMPNLRIYGEKGKTFTFMNGSFFHAEILMPTSELSIQGGNYYASVKYREFSDSILYNNGKDTSKMNFLGGIYCANLNLQNVPIAVYMADANRSTVTTPPSTVTTYNPNASNGAADKDITGEDGDWFNNDHLGAS